MGHKTRLHKLKKIKIIPNIFCDQNALKLKIHFKKEVKKCTDMQRLNSTLVKDDWVKE